MVNFCVFHLFFERNPKKILPFYLLHASFFLPVPQMFHKKQLVIHAYDLDTTDTTLLECFYFYNSVCVQFIPDGDLVITVYFFYNSGWVLVIFDCELVIPICLFFFNSGWVLFIPDCHMSTAVYFFTTLDACCLFLIVIWTSLFVFLTTLDGCCLFLIGTWPWLFTFVATLDGCCLFPIPHLQHNVAWHGHRTPDNGKVP